MRKIDNYGRYEDINPHPDLLYELVLWQDIKNDFVQGENTDDNNGLEFGVYWLDDNDQICDAEWFKTDEERFGEVDTTNKRLREAFYGEKPTDEEEEDD